MLGTALWVGAPIYGAAAGFIDSFGEWRKLSPLQKSSYVTAPWDIETSFLRGDDNAAQANVDGLKACGTATSLDDAMLVIAIERWHKAHAEHWDKPPFFAFNQAVMLGVCKAQVNEARIRLKLAPLR